MDLKRFINSRAVYEYWQEIGYTPDSLGAAWLVYNSKKATLNEQIEAWREIARTMPDMKIPRIDRQTQYDSLHAFLKDYSDILLRFIAGFYESDAQSVYVVQEYCEGRFYDDEANLLVFGSMDEIKNYYKQDDDPPQFYKVVKKRFAERFGPEILLNGDFEPVYSSYWVLCLEDEEECDIELAFNNLFCDFPVPFKKGDIVYIPALDEADTEHTLSPTVVINADYKRHNKKSIEYYDSWDMDIYGCTLDPGGFLFSETFGNYMDMEYYKGGFDGKLEIIRLVSLFLLGEINADLFANSYFILQLKDVIKTAMPFGYSDGTLCSLGLVEEDE
ncbi:MAG: hypothetical protein II702_07285 [Clostridia bacterium]|nr:hypothetical protein [Clostridia bacterium]